MSNPIETYQNIFEWAKDHTQGWDDKNMLIDDASKFTDALYDGGVSQLTYTSGYWTSPNGTDNDIEVRRAGGNWTDNLPGSKRALVEEVLSWNGYKSLENDTQYLGFQNGFFKCDFTNSNGSLTYKITVPSGCYWHDVYYSNPFTMSLGFSGVTPTNVNYGCIVAGVKIGFFIAYKGTYTQNDQIHNVGGYSIFTIDLVHNIREYLGHTRTGDINKDFDDKLGSAGVVSGLTGIFKMASDKITKPTKPSVGVSSSGFVNVYKIDPQSLVDLGKDLFSDVDIDFDECVMTSEEFTNFINTSLTLSGVTLASVPQEMIEQGCGQEITVGMSLASIFKLLKASVRNFFSSQLIKYVIDCHIIPCSPTHGNDERINIGYREFSQVGKKLSEDYIDVSCGTLDLKGYYQNFLDAQTKMSLFLPFIGFVELSPQQFLMDGAKISVDYRFNVLDGSCIAYVSSNKIGGDTSIIGVYSGSCCVHLPITGENYSSMVSGMMQTIGGVASGIATGNPMLAGGSIVGGVSNMLSNMSGTQLGNNNFSCSASFMGIRKPYIVIERPVAQLPPRFFKDKGGMAQMVDKLSKFNGFTKCTDVQMPNDMPKSISDNIKSLLESGVIL